MKRLSQPRVSRSVAVRVLADALMINVALLSALERSEEAPQTPYSIARHQRRRSSDDVGRRIISLLRPKGVPE